MSVERLANMGEVTWAEAGADHMARYLFAVTYSAGREVLDVGTGLGYGAALLKASGASAVDAFDIDEDTVAEAQDRFGDVGVSYFSADSHTFDVNGKQYDVICSFENIEHIPEPERFVRAARASLNPGGVLICSTPARERSPQQFNGRPHNPFHLREWFRSEFQSLLEQAFDVVEMHSQVESFSLLQRRQAVEALIAILRHPLRGSLLSNGVKGVLRVTDAVGWQSLRRASGMTGDVSGLACPTPADFPIVPASVAPLFGTPFAHCAVCRV